MKITPTCKYGHGDLVPIMQPPKIARWFVPALDEKNTEVGMGYGLVIYKCQHCTYLEFHDDEGLE